MKKYKNTRSMTIKKSYIFFCDREPEDANEVFQLLLIVGVCTLLLKGNNVDHSYVIY